MTDYSKFTQALEQLKSDLSAIQAMREFNRDRFVNARGEGKAYEHFMAASRGLELLPDKYHGYLSSNTNSEYSDNFIDALSHAIDFIYGISKSAGGPFTYIPSNSRGVSKLKDACFPYLKEADFTVIDDKTYRAVLALISFIDKILGEHQTWTLHKMSPADAAQAIKCEDHTYNNSYIFDGKNLHYIKSNPGIWGGKIIKIKASEALKKKIMSFDTDSNQTRIILSDSQVTSLMKIGAPDPENKCSDELSKLDKDLGKIRALVSKGKSPVEDDDS